MIPSSAAGAGPRNTMAMISARKLPEFRTLAAPVRIACRSDAIAHAASATSSGRSTPCQSRLEKTMTAPTHNATTFVASVSRAGRVAVTTNQLIGTRARHLERLHRTFKNRAARKLALAKAPAPDVDRAAGRGGNASSWPFGSACLEAHNPESFRSRLERHRRSLPHALRRVVEPLQKE